MDAQTITEQALKLAPAARAYIAEILIESLDYEEDFPVSDEWRQEIQKRCKEIDANSALLLDGEQVMAELRQRFL
ncbi:addiction module antitoxin RelB [Methylomonas sp. LWB]|uniref:addiction module protein n=1 Tax=Methylomonas sp. LWB TaxID=1905845 RepID=UPI0008DA9877|nr:addiction module protein [Methylomonas sp. LWB]OHX37665.1 addiction module antitoxin RelB [Methylomonas sp. LWB]